MGQYTADHDVDGALLLEYHASQIQENLRAAKADYSDYQQSSWEAVSGCFA